MHDDSIITKNKQTAKKFLKNVKSSIAMHNTSTQFADGGEFGVVMYYMMKIYYQQFHQNMILVLL